MLCSKRAEEFFFDRFFGNEDEYLHRLFLAHAVSSSNTLFQYSGVPGKVDIDHGVCSLQVQPGRAGVCRQEQTAAGIALKIVDQSLPQLLWHRTIEADEGKTALLQERLDQIEHRGPFREEEHLAVLFRKQPVE